MCVCKVLSASSNDLTKCSQCLDHSQAVHRKSTLSRTHKHTCSNTYTHTHTHRLMTAFPGECRIATLANCPIILFFHLFLKGKGSSLHIAPLTILDRGALQPRKWQLIGTGCNTAA